MRNDVYNNRYHVPVISSPNPANEAMMRDSVNIYVIINNEFIGHVGLDHINIISHYYLVYLIVITPVFVFLNGKMNSLYKCLFYFVFPYFLSLFAWYTHIYFDLPKNSNLGSGTLLGEFGYITVTIYIIYGSFLIPLIACLCEIFIRLLYRYLYRFY